MLKSEFFLFSYLAFIDDSREPKTRLFVVRLVVDLDGITIGENRFFSLRDSLTNACYWKVVSCSVNYYLSTTKT